MTRPIDTYESTITAFIDRTEAGESIPDAARTEATAASITPDRLFQLTNVWCAIAGIPTPSQRKHGH